MKRQLLLLLFIVPFLGASQQSLVTHWDFNSLVNDANAATGTNMPVSGPGSFDVIGGATSSYATGYTGTVLPTEANTTDNSGFNASGWPAQVRVPKPVVFRSTPTQLVSLELAFHFGNA